MGRSQRVICAFVKTAEVKSGDVRDVRLLFDIKNNVIMIIIIFLKLSYIYNKLIFQYLLHFAVRHFDTLFDTELYFKFGNKCLTASSRSLLTCCSKVQNTVSQKSKNSETKCSP